MDRSNLISRAEEISEAARFLADKLAKHNQPEPTFEHGLPPALRSDLEEADTAAMSMCLKLTCLLDEFRDLLTEPSKHLSPETRNPSLSIFPIVRLKIHDHVPEEGISVPDLAKKIKMDENIVRRLMSHAATYHVFFQSRPDYFIHTASSQLLAENEGMQNWCLFGLGETMPAAFRIPELLLENGYSEEPKDSAWSFNNSTDLPVFSAVANTPERAAIFSKAMAWHNRLPGFSPKYLIDHFPFNDGETTVVDIGGGIGHISQALASHNPSVKCIVQDLPEYVAQGKQMLPTELESRVRFQAHDFFQEQPVKDADIYLLRHVLHDWSNTYARKILKALIPALKPGAKIILNDRVIPGFGEAHYLLERESRDYDLYMFTLTNAQERTRLDWDHLFRDTDPRFKLMHVYKPEGSILHILEVTWEG
ncbi:O-methyltransferase family 2 [Penicillium malachiteum]|uniref:O-methyltransferase family 2 n=1 Tax=Penicillium malachiteum TaxID=1324776 RepID=UPI0025495446|nr:O-methyltransferase family 2 [Penicillium malachiteum]KAJ5721473.1 O-methyltransferase family 2 [Penicillium malachiteum]